MSLKMEKERLRQEKALKKYKSDFLPTEMVTLELSEYRETHYYGVFCALLPISMASDALQSPSWEYSGVFNPGTIIYPNKNGGEIKYFRYGNDINMEPLVIRRDFYDIRSAYLELNEEFRLFHNLYHDSKNKCFIKYDDSGNETIVARIDEERARIRIYEIRQFLAAKDMVLVIQFDLREHSSATLEELKLTESKQPSPNHDNNICWDIGYGDFHGISDHSAFSRLLGKRLIYPLPKEKTGLYGYTDEEEHYEDFIIGITEDGDHIVNTCDPDALKNNFGANPTAPHYLTYVYFKKSVLDRYYQEPQKYFIKDGHLGCGSLWSIPVDNHQENVVRAWLGDLGRDLPACEQLHWKLHNIPPEETTDKTFFMRQLMCQPTNSERPEHCFISKHRELEVESRKTLGWPILLPLSPEDSHHLERLRIPSTDEQHEFDSQILSLTKIVVDSLNERQLNNFLSANDKGSVSGSISKLEYVFNHLKIEGHEKHIFFLRTLQGLRSSCSAHRKGRNYHKATKSLGIEEISNTDAFEAIVVQANEFLDFLMFSVSSGKIVFPSRDLD